MGRKVDSGKVMASLTTRCPKCHYDIPPNETQRVSFTEMGREPSRQTHQSDGGVSIPQKFSGLSKSNPSSHEVSSMTEMTSAIRPFLLRPFEISFTVTGVSFLSRSWTITPQP